MQVDKIHVQPGNPIKPAEPVAPVAPVKPPDEGPCIKHIN